MGNQDAGMWFRTSRVVARPATDADVDFLVEVVIAATEDQGRLPADFDEAQYRQGYADWTREQVRDEIPDSSTYVLGRDGQRIGRLRVIRAHDHVELAGLQLLPLFQGQGIGSTIIQHLMEEATTAGVPFDLWVEKDNPRARALYERLGLRTTSESDTEDKLTYQAECSNTAARSPESSPPGG